MAFSFGASALPQQKNPQQQMQAAPAMQFPPWLQAMFAPQAQAPAIDWNAIGRIARPPDVQGETNRSYIPGQGGAGSPWAGPLQFNNTAASMTPEAVAASQGRSATTQWGLLGGVPGVDPQKLQNIMGQMTPTPGPQATPQAMTSDPFFAAQHQQRWPEAYGQPFNPQAGLPPDLILQMILNHYGAAPTLSGRNVIGDETGPRYRRPL